MAKTIGSGIKGLALLGFSVVTLVLAPLAAAQSSHGAHSGRQPQVVKAAPERSQHSKPQTVVQKLHQPKIQTAKAHRPFVQPQHKPLPVQRGHQPQVVRHHAPPRDWRTVRAYTPPRGYIRSAPLPPRHVRVVRGKPMPHGWGVPLTVRERAYLPHYHGYEWRRVGRDLVLITLATGIVYGVLDNVLS